MIVVNQWMMKDGREDGFVTGGEERAMGHARSGQRLYCIGSLAISTSATVASSFS